MLAKELDRQIKAGIFERSLIGNNKQSSVLKQSYPAARQYFKDSYIVDFLNLPEVHSEKSLHNGLIKHECTLKPFDIPVTIRLTALFQIVVLVILLRRPELFSFSNFRYYFIALGL